MGDVRLLRDADRLERRDPPPARARVRRGARRRAARPLPRARAGASGRRNAQLPRGLDRGDASAWRGPQQGGRARPVTPHLAAVPRGSGCPRRVTRPRLETRDPFEHRPRLHRRLDARPRRPIRVRDRRLRARFLQARPPPLGALLRANASTARAPRARRSELFHDIAPANELSLRSIWINRLGESANPQPTRELHDLSQLADTLDELVPA